MVARALRKRSTSRQVRESRPVSPVVRWDGQRLRPALAPASTMAYSSAAVSSCEWRIGDHFVDARRALDSSSIVYPRGSDYPLARSPQDRNVLHDHLPGYPRRAASEEPVTGDSSLRIERIRHALTSAFSNRLRWVFSGRNLFTSSPGYP